MLLQGREVTLRQDLSYCMDEIPMQQSTNSMFCTNNKWNLSNASTNKVGVRHDSRAYFSQRFRCGLGGMTHKVGDKHSDPVFPVVSSSCSLTGLRHASQTGVRVREMKRLEALLGAAFKRIGV